ncbi:MAG: glucose-6-phosphate isomerase [Patescibacteria group bacterium]
MKIQLVNTAKKLPQQEKVWREFEKCPPAFFALPLNPQDILGVNLAKGNWKQILVLGIGGSSLPAQALVNALQKKNSPEFFFLDNLDPTEINSTLQKLKLSQTLVIVISKSGSTLETISQFLVIRKKLKREQIVIITDPKKGFLRELAEKEKLASFDIPSEIGGRYSVFTPVGLLPAQLAGIDLPKLLKGVQSADPRKAFEFAKIQAAEYKRGKNIAVFCPYASSLEALTKWWEQLLAESIGKSSKVGITPEAAIGPAAQHSLLQLWAAGPNDKFFTFLKVHDFGTNLKVSNPPKEFASLKNKSIQDILNAEFTAATKALAEKKRALAILELPRIDAESIGQLLQFWMCEVYFLGKLLGVNPLNQPGVERGKLLAKKNLDT